MLLPSASVRVGGSVYRLTPASSSAGPLTVDFRAASHGGCMADWTVYLKNNRAETSPRVSELEGLSLFLPLCADDYFHVSTLRGDNCSVDSFLPEEFDLACGESLTREPFGGRSSNTTAFPYFDLSWPGASLVCGLGWSGQWRLTISRDRDGVTVTAGQAELDTVLYPGEAIRSIRALIYQGGEDIVRARQEFIALHRRYVSPAVVHGEGFESPIAVQCFDRYFWGAKAEEGTAPYFETEEAQIKLCNAAGKCGIFDTHWVDACWYKDTFRSGVGNYSEYSVGFPNGLKPVSEAAHKNKMKLIVWFEPMRALPGTEVWKRFEAYPEKLVRIPDSEQALVNLGDPEVWQWMYDKIVEIMVKNGIDRFREDYNIDPLGYLRAIETEDRRGMAQLRFVEGLYRLWDALRARFPGLFIDNCASGGRNLDVETCSRALSLWQSDTACQHHVGDVDCALIHQNQHRALSRYLPYHQASSFTTDAYTMRSSGSYGISCEFDFLSDAFDANAARAAVSEVRRLSRYWEGDFTQLTPPSKNNTDWCVWCLTLSPEEGMLTALRRPAATAEFCALIPGLSPEKRYEVTLIDDERKEEKKVLSGKEMAEGLTLTIERAPGSLVILWKAI